MDRAVTERVLNHLIIADGALQDAFGELKEIPDTPETHQAKHRIALLIALMGTGLYKPLYLEHPELCPEGLRFMLERPSMPIDWPFGEGSSGST